MQEIKRNNLSLYNTILASTTYYNYIEKKEKLNDVPNLSYPTLEIAYATLILFLWTKTTFHKYYVDNRLLPIVENFKDHILTNFTNLQKHSLDVDSLMNYLTDNLMQGNYTLNNNYLTIGEDNSRITVKYKYFSLFLNSLAKLGNNLWQEKDECQYMCIPLYKIPQKDFKIKDNYHFNDVIKKLICLQYKAKLIDEQISLNEYEMRLNVILNTLKNEINKAFTQKQAISCTDIIARYKKIFQTCHIDFQCDLISSCYQDFLNQMNIYYYENKEYFISLTYEEQYQIIEQKLLKFMASQKKSQNIFQIITQSLETIAQLSQGQTNFITQIKPEEYEDLRLGASFNLIFNAFLNLNYTSLNDLELMALYDKTAFDYAKLDFTFFRNKLNSSLPKDSVVEEVNKTQKDYTLIKDSLQKMRQVLNDYLKKNHNATLNTVHPVIYELHKKINTIQNDYNELVDKLNYYNDYTANSLNMYLANKNFLTQIITALINQKYEIIFSKRYSRHNLPIINFTLENQELYLSPNEMNLMLSNNNLLEIENYLTNAQVVKKR